MFPFSAIVGQDLLKKALLLSVTDPRIGGVLISGPRGTAKSTLARSLTAVADDRSFITLPLGAGEEMVTGSLQLDTALSSGEVKFSPGLLAKAHNGLLYVDEVNLLPDHLVDLLLDVAASGVNHVERDGVSHQHPASFVLLGTMNPDEGELRPQLLDRFGLYAPVQTDFSSIERRQIVAARLAYDSDPAQIVSQHADADNAIADRIRWARGNLASIKLDADIAAKIADICAVAEVEGLRADIAMHRACCTNAALAGRQQVVQQDLEEVQELVLAHRRKSLPQQGQGPDSGSSNNNSGASEAGNNDQRGSSIQGSWGASDNQPATTIPLDSNALFASTPTQTATPSALKLRTPSHQPGHHAGQRQMSSDELAYVESLDWFHTLSDTDNVRQFRSERRLLRLHYRRRQPRSLALDIILLDTSASTLGGGGLGRAKGALQYLGQQAYLQRHLFSVVTFGNDQVRMLLSPQRANKDLSRDIEQIQGGGGTPLGKALDFVRNIVAKSRHQKLDTHLFLFTDGRVRETGQSLSAFLSADSDVRSTVIDIESGRIRLGLGKNLATHLGAEYLHIDHLYNQRAFNHQGNH